jgi:hypothetical protein
MRILDEMLATFLEQLFETGNVVLATARRLPAAEARAIDVLREEEEKCRHEFPGSAPVFDLDAGYWAARLLYRACQFFAARDLPVDAIREDLSERCPSERSWPAAIYSVDLTFRYVPDLHRLASGVATADPLVSELERMAAEWPFSGIGCTAENPAEESLAPIASHHGLLRVYTDRVMARGRSAEGWIQPVADAARCALGAYQVEGFSLLRPADS